MTKPLRLHFETDADGNATIRDQDGRPLAGVLNAQCTYRYDETRPTLEILFEADDIVATSRTIPKPDRIPSAARYKT